MEIPKAVATKINPDLLTLLRSSEPTQQVGSQIFLSLKIPSMPRDESEEKRLEFLKGTQEMVAQAEAELRQIPGLKYEPRHSIGGAFIEGSAEAVVKAIGKNCVVGTLWETPGKPMFRGAVGETPGRQ